MPIAMFVFGGIIGNGIRKLLFLGYAFVARIMTLTSPANAKWESQPSAKRSKSRPPLPMSKIGPLKLSRKLSRSAAKARIDHLC